MCNFGESQSPSIPAFPQLPKSAPGVFSMPTAIPVSPLVPASSRISAFSHIITGMLPHSLATPVFQHFQFSQWLPLLPVFPLIPSFTLLLKYVVNHQEWSTLYQSTKLSLKHIIPNVYNNPCIPTDPSVYSPLPRPRELHWTIPQSSRLSFVIVCYHALSSNTSIPRMWVFPAFLMRYNVSRAPSAPFFPVSPVKLCNKCRVMVLTFSLQNCWYLMFMSWRSLLLSKCDHNDMWLLLLSPVIPSCFLVLLWNYTTPSISSFFCNFSSCCSWLW